MPWHGYNFEDAIVLNKRLVAEDTLTSVHIDEYVAEARDTELGPEGNYPRYSKRERIRAYRALMRTVLCALVLGFALVIFLVGKVTLKGDIQYSPEEKLLSCYFW